ncbi:MAG: flippase, partial [Candidatus Pacebacteria bacterium]|nr:flippase [Candidatus Paceibacterota bacterium]
MNKIKNFLFTNISIRQTIVKNTFWLGISTTISRIVRGIVIIYAARILGAENYGIFTYAMSLGLIFITFSDIGLSGLLTRELSKREGADKESFAATALLLKLGLIILGIIATIILGPTVASFETAKPLMAIIALLLAFDSLRSFVYSISRSENKMQTEAGLEIITEVFITVLCLFMLFQNPSAKSLAIGYTIGSGLGLMGALVVFRKYIINISTKTKNILIKPILGAAWPFAIIGVFSVLMTSIDSVIIGIYTNTSTLGLYGAAQRPISLLYLVPGFIYTSIFPIMSRLVGNNKNKQISVLTEKSMTLLSGISLPIVVGGIILASPIISVAYGQEFIGSVLTFKILLLTLLPVFPGMILSNVIFAENKQKIFIKSTLLGACTNIALDFLLIPIYGIAGSAIATFIAQIVMNG